MKNNQNINDIPIRSGGRGNALKTFFRDFL